MNQRVFFWSLTSSLAGFLFGFDTVVISGAEKSIQSLWELGDLQHGLAMSAALWGTVLGSLVGGWPTDRFGRKTTLLWIGILYLVSAVWSGMATDVFSFMIARFIGGVGVGISTVAAPLYISEIAPPERRGRLTGLFQFNIVFGILIAFASNYVIGSAMQENAWRWMLVVEAIPALVFTAMCLQLPSSPRWLIAFQNNGEAAAEVLRQLRPDASEDEVQGLVNEIAESAGDRLSETPSTPFWSRRLMTPISIAFLVAFFNQLSGINAILYFSPRIFELAEMGEQTALLQSIGIGVTNLIFTFVGLYLIDRLGRRTLLLIGSAGYIMSLGICSYAFQSETFSIVPICIFAFIAAHAMGQGAVIWVLISEVFPNSHRAAGQSLGSFTHWIFAALLTLVFPSVVAAFSPAIIFGFFCLMMVLQALWVTCLLPETKGVSLEQMERQLGIR
ncbi:sugar porter family MFS transporter [Rhodopirellula halodulae]|uniref:sugar porter family MFS transporter n=1 Tax=Rhodopirellula halodulae TaxID=2894198 RepID=UPI001E3DEA43|nr:sugar porter family MFS transporter [Rhodopirellula sp. JC737]MCC9654384.1 sugar porter family MFS transporter [Rhodopirellula sp. JC737]